MSTEIPEPSSIAPAPDEPGLPDAAARRRVTDAGDLTAGLATAVVSVVLSIPVGALWVWLAPSVLGTADPGGPFYTAPEGKSFIGQDGTLGIICLVTGLVLGTLAFLLFRKRGSVGAVLGLAAGGLAGAGLATKVGGKLGPGGGKSVLEMATKVANNDTFALPMQLRASGMLWFWPLAAVALYFILTMLFGPLDPVPEEPAQLDGWAQGWPQSPAGHADGSQNDSGQVAQPGTGPAEGPTETPTGTPTETSTGTPTEASVTASADKPEDSPVLADEVDRRQ